MGAEAPGWAARQIPLLVGKPRAMDDHAGKTSIVVDVLYNPWVLVRLGRKTDASEENFIRHVVDLALKWVADELGEEKELRSGWKVSVENGEQRRLLVSVTFIFLPRAAVWPQIINSAYKGGIGENGVVPVGLELWVGVAVIDFGGKIPQVIGDATEALAESIDLVEALHILIVALHVSRR